MAQANMSAVERIKAAREKSLRLMQMDADGTLDKYLKEGKVQRSTQASEAPMQPNVITTLKISAIIFFMFILRFQLKSAFFFFA